MKKLYTLLLAFMACLTVSAEKTYTFQLTENWAAMSTTYGDATAWGTSYATHTLNLSGGTLVLTLFSKQTATVTDCPVTKAGPVTFTLTNTNAHILKAEIQCEQWGSRSKTVTLNKSTDGGTTFKTAGVSSYDFQPMKGTFTADDAVNAVKWTFNNASGSGATPAGVKYVTVITDETESSVVAPVISPNGGTFYGAQTVTLSCATEGAAIKFSTDNENFYDYDAAATVSLDATCTLYAKAVKGEEESAVAKADFIIGKTYASLDELVADGAPTATKVPVQLTLTEDRITALYNNGTGSVNGLYFKSGNQKIMIFGYNVPSAWESRGKVSGTITGDWYLYTSTTTGVSTWELQIAETDWAKLTYVAPVKLFDAKDSDGKSFNKKFTTRNFTLTCGEENPASLTYKVNDSEVSYDAEKGLTIDGVAGSKTNDVYTVAVYNGTDLVGSQKYTFIPTVYNVSDYKSLDDNTEAVLYLNTGKVTCVKGSNVYLEDDGNGILAYNTGLSFTAYKELAASRIWGKKTTAYNVVEITKCDSIYCSSVNQTGVDAAPTTLTIAQTMLDANQQRYVKVPGVMLTNVIENETEKYYASSGADQVLLSDKFSNLLLYNLKEGGKLPCLANVTGIVTTDSNGNKYVAPTAIDTDISTTVAEVDASIHSAHPQRKFLQKGTVVIVKNGDRFNTAGSR